MRPGLRLLLAALCAGVAPSSAGAGQHVAVTLLSESASVQAGRPFTVGLRMKMSRGWHVYWKNPGDSGLPPRVAWSLPPGFTAGPIQWAAPERIPANTLVSYGYTGEVLLPVEIMPPERLDLDSVRIAGRLEWLECADVCVPGSTSLSLSLPVRAKPPSPGRDARAFADARSRMPAPAAGWTSAAEAGPRAVSLRFRAPVGVFPRGAYLFVDEPLVVDYAAPQGFERVGDGYRITVPPAANAPGTLERLTGVLVVEGRSGPGAGTAVRVDVPVTRGVPSPAPSQPARPRSLTAQRLIVAALACLGLVLLVLRLVRAGGGNTPPPRESNA